MALEEESATEEVLERLRHPASAAAERAAVLDAEVLAFDVVDSAELCALLRAFVLKFRTSDVFEDLVAVGSGIRKLVAYLAVEDLGSLAEILEPGPGSRIPIDLELEVAKTIVRRLTASPPAVDDPEPVLGDRLFDIARTFIDARVLGREKCGATALNAALALMLLRSPHAAKIASLVHEAGTRWFTDMLCRRATQIQHELRRSTCATEFNDASRAVMAFLEDRGSLIKG